MESGEWIVSASNLSKNFGNVPALKNVSFRIQKGQIVALMGANGSGKSTLIKILSLSMKPLSGSFELLGLKNQDITPDILAKIGIVYHKSLLYPELTAMENLIFSGKILELNDVKMIVERYARRLNVHHRLKERVKNLSRGERQKISLIRAFFQAPDLFLLDEPFSGLDRRSALELEKIFQECKENKKTLLFSTHHKDYGYSLSDLILELNRGEVSFFGKREDFEKS